MTEKKKSTESPDEHSTLANEEVKVRLCGIIMPLAAIDDLPVSHWQEVQDLIIEGAKSVGFKAKMVSSEDNVGVIMDRIITNLYSNEMVVCDISCRNPNVMFELGVRLAFDKPTVIIKDDQTPFPFDTSAIEHLIYPRDLRYSQILKFKEVLASKIEKTYIASLDPGYKTFLKNFGTFNVQNLKVENVDFNDYVVKQLENLTSTVASIQRSNNSHDAIATSDEMQTRFENEAKTLSDPGRIRTDIIYRIYKKQSKITFKELMENPSLTRRFATAFKDYMRRNGYYITFREAEEVVNIDLQSELVKRESE